MNVHRPLSVGFAAKKYAPRASLAVLLAAPLFSDLLWPPFLLLGWERVCALIPVTQSSSRSIWFTTLARTVLLLCAVWATAFSFSYDRITHNRPDTIAIWIGVMSHWVLDWLTHRPDMPLYPGGLWFGLGLWNSVAGTMVVEIAMFGVEVWLYVRATRARDALGSMHFSPMSCCCSSLTSVTVSVSLRLR